MPEIDVSEKRQGLHLACFHHADVESKRDLLARSPKMPVNCESQANRAQTRPTQQPIANTLRTSVAPKDFVPFCASNQ
jgi:hypothetical protein